MGQGFNRLNKYIVRRVAQGFANYINRYSKPKNGVAIAYDSRNNSEFFAKEAALVLCANNIPVHIYPTLQTTPALSYAIRKLNCVGGLCFTASHNPPMYNGIKVYWEDGAQITAPQDAGILKEVFDVTSFSLVKLMDFNQAEKEKLFHYISDSVLDSYYKETSSLTLQKNNNSDLKIVYTPLHGTGKIPALHALKEFGFSNVFVVPEQGEPDGNFPTVKKPNPEEPEALTLAIQHAQKINADIVCATDPDSDRLAVCVYAPDHAKGLFKGQSMQDYVLLNGNQTGALLINYLLSQKALQKTLKPTHKIIKTIVTSELHTQICQKFNVEIFNTLTGFKWIAALVRQWEEAKNNFEYLFGTEESYGFMPGNFVRDKDGISSLCLATEMAAYYKSKGLTLVDQLLNLFEEFGAWQEDLINVEIYGETGLKAIQNLMSTMRKQPLLEWNGVKVAKILDYTVPQTQQETGIPSSNVLQFCLEDGSKISMRPSGTEPKLKYYVSVCTKGKSIQENYTLTLEKIAKIREILNHFTKTVQIG